MGEREAVHFTLGQEKRESASKDARVTRRYGKVTIIPCSGIGTPFGSISREATYIVVDDLRPGVSDTLCLSLLVMGDEDARRQVRELPCITVDACSVGCARKSVELAGGSPMVALGVVDLCQEHQGLKPVTITELDEAGRRLANLLAERIAAEVDEIREALRW
jgi:uncharacterized metal-binding protein